ELAIGSVRYETLRKLNNRQFAYLNKLNLEGRNLDDMIDEIAAGTLDWSGMAEVEHNLIYDLVRGIESWAADEDGVHDECWKAYERAKQALGEW
ncbi:MAG: hypothetical protein KDJ31_18210, partial [Candidatus Competibacteraceae bacterium]|nr:hypothetical protein [Candidatus Competibacteraceae bacterium]